MASSTGLLTAATSPTTGSTAANRQTSTTTPAAGSTVPIPTQPNLSSYMPAAVTPGTATAGTAAASTTGAAPTASASNVGNLASITGGQINPNDSTNAASQLDAITASNSPYIQAAKQSGMLTAASRGLTNSSISAGAAENAAVQAAAPLAEQNASEATGAAMQNSQLNTQANEFNASEQNANQQLNAQLQTQTNQFNTQNQTQNSQFNTAAQTAAKEQTQSIQATLNQTGLQGLNAETLAAIQGSVTLGVSAQQSVNSLLTSAQSGINAVLANNNISAQTAKYAISAITTNLTNNLAISNIINGGSAGTNPWAAVPAAPATPTVSKTTGGAVRPQA